MKRVSEQANTNGDTNGVKRCKISLPLGYKVAECAEVNPSGFIWRHHTYPDDDDSDDEDNETKEKIFKVYYTAPPIHNPVELEDEQDLVILHYDTTLGGYRTNNPDIVVFPILHTGCQCTATEHRPLLSATEQEQEVETSPDEASTREFEQHTDVYKQAFDQFHDNISSQNCQEGERMMAHWVMDNHGLLCCEKRHANHLYMLDGF